MSEIRFLTALQIPVEIFIIFLVKNKTNFTVNQVIEEFFTKHKIEITYNRMNQILNDFVDSGKLSKEIKPNGIKGKETSYYSFLTIE